MSPSLILISFLSYTLLLFVVTWVTTRKADNESFYIGNKRSPWPVVAYGMIGASLSGVTFMSVPGWVGTQHFSYLVMVMGYFFGYIIIATVLLPLYYRLNLTSIYTYLGKRFGFFSHKTGSFFFLISRIIGASLRMFLVVNVLQVFIFDAWNIPFMFTAFIFVLLILLYTFQGGIKTIIWTDTLQTTFMIAAVIISIMLISNELGFNFQSLIKTVVESDYSEVFITDWRAPNNFIKQFFSGMFITIVMTGLDQDMMQKNLSCRNIKDAKKNMFSFSFVLVFVNIIFLFLGAVLFLYIHSKGIDVPAKTDDLFPTVALKYLSPLAGIVFMIGLISAAYSSADGALTALTTAFTYDFLGIDTKKYSEIKKRNIRYIVHLSFAFVLMMAIVVFRELHNEAVIQKLFMLAGYTYGPLLGLFSFGIMSKRIVVDKWIPFIALASPMICYFISQNSVILLNGYKFGFELLLLNGLLSYFGLFLISKKNNIIQEVKL